MSEKQTLTERAETEADAFLGLRKRRPCLFYALCLLLLGLILWTVYDKFWGIPKLKGHITEKDKTIGDQRGEMLRLETQLIPFKTIAIDRYPDVEIAKALGRLAEDMRTIEAELESVKGTIRTFEAEVSVEASANWTKAVVPGGRSVMVVGESPSLRLNMRLASGSLRMAELFVSGMPRYVPSGSGSVIFRYRAVGRAGGWPVGARETDLKGLEKVEAAIHGLGEGTTSDEQVRLRSAEVRLFVNGQLFHVLKRTPNLMLSLPKEGPWPALILGVNEVFADVP